MKYNYEAKIPAKDLIHGVYYRGECRNATVARWNEDKQVFFHWRHKFGHNFLEEIKHPEHETQYDVFVVEEEITDNMHMMIPFEGDIEPALPYY